MKKRVLTAACGMLLLVSGVFSTTIQTVVTGDGRSITFTWTFTSGGGDAQKGQFANGDWWVAPAAGQGDVTLTSLTGAGSGQIYCDENPQIESMGLLSKNYGNQDTDEDIIPKLPVTYAYNTSLVAVIQRDESSFGNCGTSAIVGCCADAYMVVTVLDAVPADNGANTLRPNIVRSAKELLTWDDIDLTRLPSLYYLTGTDAAGFESIRQLWSHHVEVLAMRDQDGNGYSEGGRAFRADMITDDYSATVSVSWHSHMMNMMSDDNTFDEKKKALAAMLTYGKDIWYQVYDTDGSRDRWFGVGAGQSVGRFPPAVFFAAMCEDPLYGNSLKLASTTQINLGGKSVQELDQINVGVNGVPLWGDGGEDLNQYTVGGYWGEMLNKQGFDGASGDFVGVTGGKKTSLDPYGYIDGPGLGPGSAYMGVTAGPYIAFVAELYAFPEMCDITNYDPLVEYANRIINTGRWAAPDPCAPPDPREDPSTCDAYRCQGCKYYGLKNDGEATWGPDPDSVAAGNWTACIRNHNDPLTGEMQTGRFSSIHATPFNFEYEVTQAKARWRYFTMERDLTTCKTGTPVDDRPELAEQALATAPSFTVFPNPSTGAVYIDGPSKTYKVFDRNGALTATTEKYVQLPAGVFFVTTEEGKAVQRIVIID